MKKLIFTVGNYKKLLDAAIEIEGVTFPALEEGVEQVVLDIPEDKLEEVTTALNDAGIEFTPEEPTADTEVKDENTAQPAADTEVKDENTAQPAAEDKTETPEPAAEDKTEAAPEEEKKDENPETDENK